jgi:hypothetical protein
MPGDGLSIDAELCRQLVHGGARAVAMDQASEFSLVEPLGPLRGPDRAPLGRPQRPVHSPVCPDCPGQRGGGRVREKSLQDHQNIRMRTPHQIGVEVRQRSRQGNQITACFLKLSRP